MMLQAIAGGFVGTLVLTTIAHGANELGLTADGPRVSAWNRRDRERRRAKAIGYLIHFALGLGFALAYGGVLRGGRPQFVVAWTGCSARCRHSSSATVLVNVLLPS